MRLKFIQKHGNSKEYKYLSIREKIKVSKNQNSIFEYNVSES
jgi:hypothetical protein